MNNTSALQQTIHNYCLQLLSANDFNKNQQVSEQLKKFMFDWNNLPILKQIIEIDCKPETTFVIYQLLQKSVASGSKFINVLPCTQRTHSNIEELENYEKAFYTTIIQAHLDIVINYFQKGLKDPNYVQNTVLFSVAFIMRKYWCEILNVEQYIEKLINTFFYTQNTQIIQIGCKLFENLLNCIRQYYYASGYLEFRKVMLGFQRQSLSLLLNSTHNLIINQLRGRTLLQLYQIDKGFTDSLINLLNQFMGFNFHLSFYEIDIDNDQKDNNVINFPDSYFTILNDNKLTEEYFRAVIDFYSIDQNISLKLLIILQRIASLRLSLFYGKRNHKKYMRRTLWDGLLYLLNNHQIYVPNGEFCNEICLYAIRLIFNFTLKKLNKFSDIFELCINQLNNMNQVILLKQGLKLSQNSIFIKMQELWNQLITQINLYKSLFPIQLERLQNYVKISFRVLIQGFFDQNPFEDIPDNLPIKKIKKFLDKSFRLCSQVYHQNTDEYTLFLAELVQKLPIDQLEVQQPVNQYHIIQKLSNLFCLVSALVLSQKESELLQGYDYYGQQQEIERPQNVKDLISKFFYIISYTNCKQYLVDAKTLRMFHASQLIFIYTYLQQTIENLSIDEQSQIVVSKSALLKFQNQMENQQQNQNFMIIIEKCLEKCFQIFTLRDPQLVEYSFVILQFTYEKMKRQLDRRFFRQSSLNLMLQQFFRQMEVTCFNEIQYIKKRKQVYKLVSLVWVDDFLDDYIPSLVEIYKQIKASIAVESNKINMLKYIWDLIGVIDELEVDGIYRVFLRIVFPDLASLLNQENIQTFVQDYDCCIGLATLMCAIFRNKNTRLQNENIQLLLYQIYGKAAFYFIQSIDSLIQQIQNQQQQQIQVSNSTIKMASKLFKVMGQISTSKQINQGFFLINQDTTYLTLFKKQLQLITTFRPHFQNLIKYKKFMFECLESICSEYSEALAYRCGSDIYHELLQICDQTIKDILEFKQPKGEDQINDEAIQLNQISNIIVNVMQFLIQEAIVGEEADTQMIKKKIADVLLKSKTILQAIFKNAFQISVAFNKIMKFQGSVADILYAVSLFNPLEFQQQLVQLIQEYKNTITLSSLVLDPIQIGYKAFESYLNSTTKDNYTKQIRYVLESICIDKDF